MHDTSPRLEGGTVVITGAASGIGLGLARHAATLGMRIAAADIDAQALEQLADSLDAEVLTIPTDVSDPHAVDALADAVWQHFGEVDLLFNNAGVMSTGFSWEISADRWQRDLAINLGGVLNGLRSFVPRLLAAGRPARIVNTASVGGFLPSPLMAPYSATKFAVVALTESLHGELKLLGAPVEVSLLAPGPVQSAIFSDPFDASGIHPATQQFVAAMREMLTANGLKPESFAERVFEGIRQGRYWLIPQPEALDDPLRQRTEAILARREPAPLLGES